MFFRGGQQIGLLKIRFQSGEPGSASGADERSGGGLIRASVEDGAYPMGRVVHPVSFGQF